MPSSPGAGVLDGEVGGEVLRDDEYTVLLGGEEGKRRLEAGDASAEDYCLRFVGCHGWPSLSESSLLILNLEGIITSSLGKMTVCLVSVCQRTSSLERCSTAFIEVH